MKWHVLAAVFVFGWVAVSEARPLLVEVPPYQHGSIPAVRIVLYRSENGGTFRPVQTFTNFAAMLFLDTNVKWNRTYCFAAVAQSASGTPSDFSEAACAKPRK